jgi:uncharacterized damage-inducible protein DinB
MRLNQNSSDFCEALLATYAINDSMNQLLLVHLDPRAWRAQLPAQLADAGRRGARNKDLTSKGSERRSLQKGGRTIAAIFAHLHNCRLRWLKKSAPYLKRPAPLDPYRCTMKQASAAHKQSAIQCLRMLTDACSTTPDRRVTKFVRDSWMPIWPASAAGFCYMWAYMFSHEAHHRGQITLLAHQLGYRLPPQAWGGIWQWDKLWKQSGFTTRPQ